MPDTAAAHVSFTVSLFNVPSGRIEAQALPPSSPLPGTLHLTARTDAQGIVGSMFLSPAQGRQLRLQLSRALEAYYQEHPEQLGADIEADLTMNLVPDLEPSSTDPETPADAWLSTHGLTDSEVEGLATLSIAPCKPGSDRWRDVARCLNPGSFRDQGLIVLDWDDRYGTRWMLTELGRQVLDQVRHERISTDEAIQRG